MEPVGVHWVDGAGVRVRGSSFSMQVFGRFFKIVGVCFFIRVLFLSVWFYCGFIPVVEVDELTSGLVLRMMCHTKNYTRFIFFKKTF